MRLSQALIRPFLLPSVFFIVAACTGEPSNIEEDKCDASGIVCISTNPMTSDASVTDVVDDTDAGQVDSGPSVVPEVGTMIKVVESHDNCAAGCTALGFPCTTTCEPGAGLATYGYVNNDIAAFISVHKQNIASCEESPSLSYDHTDGETYSLAPLDCCCEMPEVFIVAAVPDDARACDEICIDEGHSSCAPFATWPNGAGTGGTFAAYQRPGFTSKTYVTSECSTPPPATRKFQNIVNDLVEYSCGCM